MLLSDICEAMKHSFVPLFWEDHTRGGFNCFNRYACTRSLSMSVRIIIIEAFMQGTGPTALNRYTYKRSFLICVGVIIFEVYIQRAGQTFLSLNKDIANADQIIRSDCCATLSPFCLRGSDQ